MLQNSLIQRLFQVQLNKFAFSINAQKFALISKSTNLNQDTSKTSQATKSSSIQPSKRKAEWKENVVEVPVATTIEDLKKTHPPVKDGIYISHRSYIDKLPEKYTIEPILTKRTGGYDIEKKQKLYRRVGGGLPIYWHFVDNKRVGPKSGPPLVEKVIDILQTRDRSAFIALVAHGNTKRYIIATQNMKIGDLIKTSMFIPRIPVQPSEGDAYPLGALLPGTRVHNIEMHPGEGGRYCRAAGSSAILSSVVDQRAIVRLPSELEVSLDYRCMATVGQVSHATNQDEKLSHPVDKRDLGYRPGSGLWHRKDGYCGRRIHPPKPIKVISKEVIEKEDRIPYTYLNWSLTE